MGAADLYPGTGGGADPYGEAANLARWVDEHFLPGKKLLGTLDPEGLLSTLPAIGTALLGIFAGLLLEIPRLTPRTRVVWLSCGGLGLVAVGALMEPAISDQQVDLDIDLCPRHRRT